MSERVPWSMCLRNHGVSPLLFDLLAESHAWEVLVYLYYCCNHQRKRGFCTRPQCNQVIGLISFTAVRSRRIYRSPVSEECLSFDELFLFQKHANPPAFSVTGGCVHHRTRRTRRTNCSVGALCPSVGLLARRTSVRTAADSQCGWGCFPSERCDSQIRWQGWRTVSV